MRSAECGVRSPERPSFVICHWSFAAATNRPEGRGKALRSAECGLRIETQKSKPLRRRRSGPGGREPRDKETAKTAGGGRWPEIGVRESGFGEVETAPPSPCCSEAASAAFAPRQRRVDRGLYNILHERDHDLILLAPEGHTDL